MIGDDSALEYLKNFRIILNDTINRIEYGELCEPSVIDITRLLRARECLASARTEENLQKLEKADRDCLGS